MADRSGTATEALTQERFSGFIGQSLEPAARLAARYVPIGEVQDAVQTAALAAWRARDTFDADRGSFRTWLLTIVAREAQRLSREATRRRDLARIVAGLRIVPSGHDQTQGVDIAAALAHLTERQRQVVGLHYLADLPVTQVARLLGVSDGTIKSTLHDARIRLRHILDCPGGDDA